MVLGGLLASTTTPALGQALSTTPFSAYGAGDALALNLLSLPPTQLAGLRVAASAGTVSSAATGVPAVVNEFGQNEAPARADRNAYGRGSAIEAGILTQAPQTSDFNQIILSGLAEAFAPPPSPLVTASLDIPVDPILSASTGRGEAQATFDPVYCPVGRPLTFGRGFVENLQLLGTGRDANGLVDPVLGTSTSAGNPRATTQSRTVTYLFPNGDGTFGVASETRQTVAPIEVAGLLIEVAGEYGMRVAASGKPGGATVTTLGTPILTITGPLGVVLGPITLGGVIPPGTLALLDPILALLGITLDLGELPRALGGSGPPALAADGTSASAASDLLRLGLPLGLADLGLMHMEGSVSVPAGGIRCQIPVSKVSSIDPVTVGNDFTYTISIPNDAAFFQRFFNCDLVNISAVDTVVTESGTPRIQLLSASNGGVISGNTVTWANLGNYTLGQAPIVLTISARIPSNSGAGVLRNTVNVSATLGNCRGTGTGGEDIIGSAQLNGNAITGAVTLVGPTVTRGDLAATGGNSWPLVAGGGFLLAAMGLVRLRRRAEMVPATATTTET